MLDKADVNNDHGTLIKGFNLCKTCCTLEKCLCVSQQRQHQLNKRMQHNTSVSCNVNGLLPQTMVVVKEVE